MNELGNTATEASHVYPLISDLGLILITAGIAVLLFKRIKQPLVLGYLIAGFLAGPYFTLFPTVKEAHNVEVWAQIGVIFLLFSLGLEFSFKKLMKVGGTASITAVIQIIAMIVIGFAVGQWMDWSKMDSIFLGVMLSISSTTIILKAFDELGVKAQKFTGIVIGSLIVQDIIAILLMVLLSTIAVSQQFSGIELFESVLKLFFFLILWFVGGIFFIPTLLKKAKNLLNDETLLIISLALCLMMVIFADMAGFSPALGAFIMGSIIAETTKAERISHLIKPVKDLFGAVFFVSVGMLIDPSTLVEYALPVLILTLVTILGQSISATIGTLISGQPLKQSIQTGMSLSQIGEFSFIIATLGMLTLKVTSDFLYPIIVAVSAITTFTTPFMIKSATPFSEFLENKLPKKWVEKIDSYSTNTQAIKSISKWQVILSANIKQVIIHSTIIIAIILLSSRYISPLVEDSKFGNAIAALVTLIIIAPFIWALSLRRIAANEMDNLKEEGKYLGPLITLFLIKIGIALFYIGLLLNIFFSPGIAFIFLIIVIIVYILAPEKIHAQYHKIENHFLKNFNDRAIKEAFDNKSELTPWDGHMSSFEITQESTLLGSTLSELRLREKLGVNIAIIKRGEITINIPNSNERIFPGDVLYVIGSDDQVEAFNKYIKESNIIDPDTITTDIVLEHFILSNEEVIGKSIKASQIKEKTNGLIVGIERDGQRIVNPESNLLLKKNDVLWVVGNKKMMKALISKEY